jgi:PAS domain S-box-containing protein
VVEDLSRLIDTANAPIFGIDADGLVNEWNVKAAQLTGRSKDEVMGKHMVKNFISAEHQASVEKVLNDAMNGVATADFELPLFTKSGECREVLLNANPRRDAKGLVYGVVGVGQDITERKQAQVELHRIAGDVTRLINTANAPIFGIDKDGKVNEWNQTAAKITGYSKDEVMGKDLVQTYISEEHRESVKAVLQMALQGIETSNFDFVLFTKDGARVEVLLNATSRQDGEGHIIGVVGVGHDITELRSAQARLQNVVEDLSRLIDTANAPIFGIDADGLVNEWNVKAAQLTGRSKDEVMCKERFLNLVGPDNLEACSKVVQNALNGIPTTDFELTVIAKSGVYREVLLNANPRRDAKGLVYGVVGVGQDITDRKRAEVELHRVAADLTRLIDTANAPIFGIDKDGKVNEWNQTAAKITKYSKEEALGKDLVRDFVTAEFHDSVQAVLKAALLGEEQSNFEFEIFTKDGKRVEILLNATPRQDGEGNIVGMVGVGHDITELRRAEAVALHAAMDSARLIETANAPIFGIDRNGMVNEWNRKAAEITGRSKEEVLGRHLVDNFISTEFRNSVKAILDNALAGISTSDFELPLFKKTGERVEVLLNANPRTDESQNVIGVVGVGQDITDRKKAAIELQRVAGDLTRLIDTANAPIFGIDKDGKVNEWNQTAAKITGYPKDSVMGKNLVESYISPEHRERVWAVLSEALQGKDTTNFEFPLYNRLGGRVEVLLNATARVDASGEIIGVIGVGQDVSAIMLARLEYQRVAVDLTNLINTANAPIFGIDTGGLVNEWNEKAAQITGYTKQEVLGKHLVDNYVAKDSKDTVQAVLNDALSGISTSNFEFRCGRSAECNIQHTAQHATHTIPHCNT